LHLRKAIPPHNPNSPRDKQFQTSTSFVSTGSAGEMRSSASAGLIWDSPFGPLRVDNAMPLTRTGYDVTQRMSFWPAGSEALQDASLRACCATQQSLFRLRMRAQRFVELTEGLSMLHSWFNDEQEDDKARESSDDQP